MTIRPNSRTGRGHAFLRRRGWRRDQFRAAVRFLGKLTASSPDIGKGSRARWLAEELLVWMQEEAAEGGRRDEAPCLELSGYQMRALVPERFERIANALNGPEVGLVERVRVAEADPVGVLIAMVDDWLPFAEGESHADLPAPYRRALIALAELGTADAITALISWLDPWDSVGSETIESETSHPLRLALRRAGRCLIAPLIAGWAQLTRYQRLVPIEALRHADVRTDEMPELVALTAEWLRASRTDEDEAVFALEALGLLGDSKALPCVWEYLDGCLDLGDEDMAEVAASTLLHGFNVTLDDARAARLRALDSQWLRSHEQEGEDSYD